MKRVSLIAGVALLVLLSAPVAASDARMFPSFASSVRVSEDDSAAENSTRVSRADLIRRAVEKLYGSLDREFTAPYENVPKDAINAVGLARILGAVQEWGRQASWDSPVTRGEMLTVLLKIAQAEANVGMATEFGDVRSRDAMRIVRQSLKLRLIAPLTQRTFGWGRIVSEEEFAFALQNLAEHARAPIALPSGTDAPATRPPAAPAAPSNASTRNAKKQQQKRTVVIELGKLDSGVRNGVQKRELPKQDLLETVWGLIQSKFLYQDRINRDEIAYSLAETLFKNLNDPYSVFLRPKTNKNFQEQIQGGDRSFSGIGAHVQTHKDGGVEVVTPLTGSPAMKAGVRAGDRIIAVDDIDVQKINLDEAVAKIRGPEGSTVRLTIVRENMGGTMVISVVRGHIVLKDLTVAVQDGVAIVTLANFSAGAMTEFNAAMKGMMEKKPIGVILDLRNDPGGLLDAAVLVASHFLAEGDQIVTVDRGNGNKENLRAVVGARPIPSTMPLIVLVNKGSASASEIVAGALKDHKRAEIVGQKTFGKGTVQEAVELNDPDGAGSKPAAKVTVARWLTPNGNEIDGKGVEPTIALPDAVQGDRDEWLLEAIKIIKARVR